MILRFLDRVVTWFAGPVSYDLKELREHEALIGGRLKNGQRWALFLKFWR